MDTNNPAPVSSLNDIRSIYFIGIGGIGMSALARFFKARNTVVSGYDKTPTALTSQLTEEGIDVVYEDDVAGLPKDVDLVVYTPAIPPDHKGLSFYREQGYHVVKRSDVLQIISAGSFNICVAGTHGKTTVSTMIAHILRDSGFGCNAFLGGISVNYKTNFWSSEREVSVIEADEYDRSFLKLSPDIAVITAMDADHLDIYGTEQAMQDAFVDFSNKIKTEGRLIHKFGLKRIRETETKNRTAYSLQNESADSYAKNVKIEEGGYSFDILINDKDGSKKKVLSNLQLRVGGMHNVENMVVAVTVAVALKIDESSIRTAVANYRGVKRRFEYILPPQKQREGGYIKPVLIDDYAHHPEELRALLNSVRSLFPQRLVTVVFQPHLYSRTRDLAVGFAEVLAIADRVILLPIYPARELPIEGVSSEMILEKMEAGEGEIVNRDDLVQWLTKQKLNKEFGEVFVIAGAGDIDAVVDPVKNALEKM